MEGIEMRDFAVEAADRQARERQGVDERKPDHKSEGGRLRQFWASHIRITIDEPESRDHLALERTYLAYVRTASAYAQLGIVIAQLFRLNTNINNTTTPNTPTTLRIARVLGAVTEGIAIVIMLLGAAYFAKQQMELMKGVIVGRGYEIWVMLVLSLALLCVILGLLAGASKW